MGHFPINAKRYLIVMSLFISLMGIYGCDQLNKLGVESTLESATATFFGVKSITRSVDGKYVLNWEHSIQNDSSSISYEVFLQKSERATSDKSKSLDAVQSGDPLPGSQILQLSDNEAPVQLGTLVATVPGARSYVLDFVPDPKVTYAFQVRLGGIANADHNQAVLIYTPIQLDLKFSGISQAQISEAGKILLSWESPAELGSISAADVSYEVFMDVTPESLDSVLTGTLAIQGGTSLVGVNPEEKANLTSGSNARVWEFMSNRLPSSLNAPLEQVTGRRFYQVQEELTSGQTYLFQVRSVGPNAETDDNARVFVYRVGLESLEPFIGITSLSSNSHGEVVLAWDQPTSDDVVGFNIYEGSKFKEAVKSLDSNVTSLKLVNLTPDSSVTYGVRAFDRYGREDTNTRTLSVLVLNNLVPNFSGLTSAVLQNQKDAVLNWQPASGQPKEYRVYQGTTATGAGASVDTSAPIAVVPAPATSTTILGLGDDQDHHFIVRAAVAGGAEDQNTIAKTISVGDLGAPEFAGIKSLKATSGGITATWSAAKGQVSNYKVYASDTSPLQFTALNLKADLASTELSKTLTGLADNRTWYVGVKAVDQLAQIDSNGVVKSLTVGDLTPPLFLGFSGAGASTVPSAEDKLDLTFKRSSEPDIDFYSIRVRVNGSANAFVQHSTTAQSVAGDISYQLTGLNGSTTYDIQVKAVDTSTNESTSVVFITATTADLTAPTFLGAKSATRDVGSTPLDVDIKWDTPNSSDAVAYRVYYSKDPIQTEVFSKNDTFPLSVGGAKTIYMKQISSGSATQASLKIVDDLDENTTYYFMARSTDAAGNEDVNTAQVSYAVPTVTPPVFGGVDTAILVSGTLNVDVTWTAPGAGNPAASYEVYYSATPSTPRVWTGPIAVPAPATSYTVTGLTERQTYYFKAYAKNVEGIADENVVQKSAQVLDITPPTFGGLTSIANDGTNEVLDLKFTAATDTQGVKEYRVYWRNYPAGSFQSLGAPGATVLHSSACPGLPGDTNCEIEIGTALGMVAGTTYEFRVDAADVNIPINTAVHASKVVHMFPDFSPPADPNTVSKSPEPVGTTNVRNYTVSGTGTDGMQVRVYCYNIDTSTLIDLGICGTSTTLSGTTSFTVPVNLPDTTNSYQFKVVQYNTQNSKESAQVNAGAAVTLDRTAPALEAFSGCASGLCQDVTTIGSSGSTVDKVTVSFRADEAGSYQIKKGATVLLSGTHTASTTFTRQISASDLSNQEGAHAPTLFFTDAAGNTSAGDAFNLTLDLTAPSLNTASFKVVKIYQDDDYKLTWSNGGIGAADTFMVRKTAGGTPPTQSTGILVASALSKSIVSYVISGANSDPVPYSFTLFACDVVGNCASAPMTLDGGFSDFRVTSEGATADIVWSVESGGGTPKLAYSSSQVGLSTWDGLSNPGDPALISSGDLGCVDPAVSCSKDFSALNPWEKRYLRVAVPSTDGKGVTFSPINIFAKVPDGMVYVDKGAWPEEAGMAYASYEKFSFAVDKYEATLASGTLSGNADLALGGDGILQSVGTGSPLQYTNWYAFKRGCNNRSATLASYTGPSPMRQVHMLTGVEFVIAAHGTPDQGTQGYCNVDNRGTPTAGGAAPPDATGTSDNSKCVSTFGARNMVGNVWEWTDELLDNRNFVRFYGASASELETIAAPIFSETNGTTEIKDYDPMSAFPVIGTRSGPWTGTSDVVYQNWGALASMPTGASARAAYRGGAWYNGALAGRFALNLYDAPTRTGAIIGGRCALAAPAPAHVRFRSNSEADLARFNWRMWGETIGTTVRLAVGKTQTDVDNWLGASTGASLSDNLYTINNFTGCTDSAYNSQGFEIAGTGTTTSGALGLQGRCGIAISGLAPWEKRYVKLYATNGSNGGGSVFSETLVVARVPDGMVFVSADDWPDVAKHRIAKERGESYTTTTPFDFAIDKYEASAVGTIPNCDPEYDFPCTTAGFTGHLESNGGVPLTVKNWYSFKQGCDNRTSILGATWADQGTIDPADYQTGRRVHLATGVEWMVASFETPDSIGPQFCSSLSTFWNPGAPGAQEQIGANSMERCQSRYGARNMIGNVWEWTDDLGHNGQMVNYWTEAGDVDTGLSSSWDVAQGYATGWDFNLGFPTSSSVTQTDAFNQSDYLYENLGALSTYSAEARAAYRGGSWDKGTFAGRFALNLLYPSTVAALIIGGRCALALP